MLIREYIEDLEKRTLSPYATRSAPFPFMIVSIHGLVKWEKWIP